MDEVPYYVILEAKEGKQISLTAIESFKVRTEIVTASYLYQYNETLQGLTNRFVVKLKETTSYEQLQKLAEQNHCILGEENGYVKNQFMIHVSKISQLDAIMHQQLIIRQICLM